jgi:hypothetical protein
MTQPPIRETPGTNPDSIRLVVEALFEEVQARLATHREDVVRRVSSGEAGSGSRERERRLTLAVRQTIAVLEETKGSFKSKRLAALRADLEQVLLDTME